MLLTFISCSSGGGNSGDVNTGGNQNTGNSNNSGGNNSGSEEESLYQGTFVSAAHETSGEATVNQDATVLSFTDFKTENGPVLDVYLATDENASNYISLGELQGLEGDFDYDLPQDVDFETHKYVIIWCVDFDVNFGYAILE